jgi:ubiquitin C-terminal hydrolase
MFSIIFLILHALLSQAVYDLLMEDYKNFALPVGLVGNHHPKELTYVGIHNEGATCHINCVLQVLFHIPYFRKVQIIAFFIIFS